MTSGLTSSRFFQPDASPEERLWQVAHIQIQVSDYYGVSIDELLSRARPARIAFPRLVSMYIAREVTHKTLEDIAYAFNRTHATILHAHRTITSYLSIYPEVEQSINYLTNGAGEVDAPPAYIPYQNCN